MKKKRIAHILLVVFSAMLLVLSTAVLCAASSVDTVPDIPAFEGSGTSVDPYRIDCADQLRGIGEAVNAGNTELAGACYLQTCDLLLDGAYTPIGTAEFPFTGTYDGGGYRIEHPQLTYDEEPLEIGVFGYAKNAVFRNLTVAANLDARYTADNVVSAGLLCGRYCVDTNAIYEISRCAAQGSLSVSGTRSTIYAGGLIGYIELTKGKLVLSDCMASVALTSDGYRIAYAGGIAGVVDAQNDSFAGMLRCFFDGTLSARASGYYAYAGGIAAYFRQDPSGWLGWYEIAQLAETTDAPESSAIAAFNIKECVVGACELAAEGKLGTNIGKIAAYCTTDVKSQNLCYVAEEPFTGTQYSLNGEKVSPETLFSKSFLADTLGFDLENTWVNVEGEYLYLANHDSLLHNVQRASDESTLVVQPVNCPQGTLISVFYDANDRLTGTTFTAYDPANVRLHVSVPSNAATIRIFLWEKNSLKPLARGTLMLSYK